MTKIFIIIIIIITILSIFKDRILQRGIFRIPLDYNQIKTVSEQNETINKVLQDYERVGIKIPLDIIEELNYHNFDSEDQIKNFIQVQRNNWKLENNKKL